MERTGEGCGFFCSLKLPYFGAMSQQFCHQLWAIICSHYMLDSSSKGRKITLDTSKASVYA